MDFKSSIIDGRKRSIFYSRIFSILFLLHIFPCLPILPSDASFSDVSIRSVEGIAHVVSEDGQSGYSRIQTALDEADSGDAVVLEKGVYVENLVVEKSIEILGESGNSGDTVVAAADPEKTVLSASRDGGLPVTIKLSGVSLHGGGGPAPVLICDSSAIFELENVAVCGPYSQTDAVPLRVEISSPVEGERFETDLVEVTGSVSRPEASVFVNGVAADAAGGNFSAQGLKLSPGSNTIAVLARDGEDEAVATVEVELLAAVDLEPVRLAVSFSSDFDESLKVAGRATATVANNGSADVCAPWRIVVFEDIDSDGAFDGTADNVLGEETVSSGPKSGEAMDVAVEFAGGLLFRDSPIHGVADSEDAVEESDEGNNVASLRAVGVDLSASRLEIDDSACPDLATLAVRIGNAGDALVAAGVPVAFHAGEPGDGGTLIGTTETSRELRPGAFQDVSFAWTGPFAEAVSIYATADDDGTGSRPFVRSRQGKQPSAFANSRLRVFSAVGRRFRKSRRCRDGRLSRRGRGRSARKRKRARRARSSGSPFRMSAAGSFFRLLDRGNMSWPPPWRNTLRLKAKSTLRPGILRFAGTSRCRPFCRPKRFESC